MYANKKIGKNKYVAIAQTGAGWNVSTYSVSGNKIRAFANTNTRTLANAKKEFTRQKKKFS